MSLYDKASLIMTPSGVKSAKIYSKKPFNTNGDFTFDRNSTVATRVNKDGLIENVAIDIPRLNYPFVNGVVQDDPSLLLEPVKTNLVQYSEDFSNVYWTKNLATIISNNVISPDGTLNASKLVSGNDGQNSRIEFFPTVSDNTIYTSSLFVQKGDLDFMSLNLRGKNGVTKVAYFDIENGTVSSTINSPDNAKIENYGNGWFRVSISVNVASGVESVRAQFVLASADGSVDTSNGSFNSIYGAQLEQGSYPTSYIPTSGSTETRAAETANGAGTSADFNDSEGVLYAEIAWPTPTTSSNLRIAISDTTANNRVLIQNINHTANKLQFYVIVGTSTVSTDVSVVSSDITLFNKIAFKYKTNDFSVWINGVKVLTDTSGITFPSGTLTELAFDGGDGVYDWYGNTKEIAAFKEALTDSELESLTSWDSFNDMATGQLYSIK